MISIQVWFEDKFGWLFDPAPTRRRVQRFVHLEGPQDLEERIAPAQYVFTNADLNNRANDPVNWSTNNGTLPGQNDDVVLDGSVSNAPITWNQNFTVNSITLQNKYTAQETLNTGVVLATTTLNGGTTSQFNVKYLDPSSTIAVRVGGTSQLSNLNLSGQDGAFEVSGGAMTLASGNSKSESTINVYDNTAFNLAAGATLQMLQGADLVIYQGGTLNVNGVRGGTVLSNDGSAGAILGNQGTVNINGTAGGPGITLAIPVLNAGVFNANGGGNALQRGSTIGINGQDNLTNNSDLDMVGGQVNLSGATRLQFNHSYTQTAGTLQTTDSLAESFVVSPTTNLYGNATVSGGNIKIGTATTYGELDVYVAAFNMSGEYDPKVNGAMNGQNDKLVFSKPATGFLNNLPGSTITVTVVGGKPALNNAYTVIQGSSKALQDFTNPNLAGLTVNPAQLTNGNYELDQK